MSSFSYDRLGRRVLTTYPDQSTASQHYDFLGRVDSRTDQAYGYDEVGERVSQTDANGHITRFAYDRLGRRSSRTLPLGQAESCQYDAVGNLTQKTDFNGHTTTYAYDNMNRLQSKTADAFFSTGTCAGGVCGATSVSFTYTNTGRRRTMTDATGVTTYGYDDRDRLLSKATPFGALTYTYDLAGNTLTLYGRSRPGAGCSRRYDRSRRFSLSAWLRCFWRFTGCANRSWSTTDSRKGFLLPRSVRHL
jgi:YD repeat-containing protein